LPWNEDEHEPIRKQWVSAGHRQLTLTTETAFAGLLSLIVSSSFLAAPAPYRDLTDLRPALMPVFEDKFRDFAEVVLLVIYALAAFAESRNAADSNGLRKAAIDFEVVHRQT
jgi:hypothetical protein